MWTVPSGGDPKKAELCPGTVLALPTLNEFEGTSAATCRGFTDLDRLRSTSSDRSSEKTATSPLTFHLSRYSWAGLVTAFWLSSSLASPVSGQALHGHLLELGTEIPISGGSVSLIDEEGGTVVSTFSNSSGLFLLQAPSPGRYSVSAEALGYVSTTDGPLELTEGPRVQAFFHLQRNPLVLDSLRISVEQRTRRLEIAGFFERKQTGFGAFVEREEIEKRDPRFMSDLFRGRLGFRVAGSPGSARLVSRRSSTFANATCMPVIYLDGIPMERGSIDALIHPSSVEAIEAYSGTSQLPAQYSGAGSGCGVVLIWTRRGGGAS